MKKTIKTLSSFTLTEMLIVIAVILILVAILLPALYQAEFFAQLSMCKSNLKQQTTGLTNYASDFRRFYPDGGKQSDGGAGIGATGLGRWIWHFWPNYPYANTLATYYNNNKYNDYRDLGYKNELFICPRGFEEDEAAGGRVHTGAKAFYGHTVAAYPGESGRTFHDGVHQPYVYKTPGTVLRRLGEKWRATQLFGWWTGGGMPAIEQSDSGMLYEIIGMDPTMRRGNNGISTNHVWGGDRVVSSHSGNTPYSWYSDSGRPTVNHAMTDGSVRDFTYLNSSGTSGWRRVAHITTGPVSIGSNYIIPKGYGEDDLNLHAEW